jgi:hypothetical protein
VTDVRTTFKHQGDFFVWALPDVANYEEAILRAEELGGADLLKMVPPVPKPEVVLNRLLALAEEHKKFHVPVLRKDKAEICWAVNEKTEGSRNEYTTHAVILLDRKSGELDIEGTTEGTEELKTEYEKYKGKLSSHEWSRMATRCVKEVQAFAWRPSGGTYWVETSADGTPNVLIRQLQALFVSFGGRLPISRAWSDDETMAGLRSEITEGLLIKFEEIKDKFDELDEDTQAFVLERRRDEIVAFIERMEALTEQLGLHFESNINWAGDMLKRVVELCTESGDNRFAGV